MSWVLSGEGGTGEKGIQLAENMIKKSKPRTTFMLPPPTLTQEQEELLSPPKKAEKKTKKQVQKSALKKLAEKFFTGKATTKKIFKKGKKLTVVIPKEKPRSKFFREEYAREKSLLSWR